MLRTKLNYLFKRYIKNDLKQVKQFEFYSNGSKYWYLNGKPHREDGPAVEYSDGTKQWCLYGEFHNLDGPAHRVSTGYHEWWVSGNHYYTHAEYKTAVENYRMINKKKKITRG